MSTCPVCNNTIQAGQRVCAACGYHLQETTEAFQRLDVDAPNANQKQAVSTATLRVLYGENEGLVYRLTESPIAIGRSPKCEVFLNDMTVSRQHAVLEQVGSDWSIKDTDSFNGVWVNNTNVDHVMLADRDVIQIGRFVLRYTK